MRRFHFLKEIASGGFGSVYVAKVMEADGFSRLMAVKLLHQRWSDNVEISRRMKDEARLLGCIRHRNIVNVHGFTTIGGRVAVMMEYLEAVDLKVATSALLEDGKQVPLRAALEIAAGVASALDAAYNLPPFPGDKPLRVIHRDIKPSNIMLDESGVVKVLDFGVARAEFDQRESHTQELQFGSVDYMPPERLFFEPESDLSDVYSLGTTLYELLALDKLGKAKGRAEKHAQFLDERIDVLRGREDMQDLNGEAVLMLLRSMLSHAADRRPTAAEIVTRTRSLARACTGHGLQEWSETAIPPLVQNARNAMRDPNPLTDAVLFEDTGGFRGDDSFAEPYPGAVYADADSAVRPRFGGAPPAPPVLPPPSAPVAAAQPPAARRSAPPLQPAAAPHEDLEVVDDLPDDATLRDGDLAALRAAIQALPAEETYEVSNPGPLARAGSVSPPLVPPSPDVVDAASALRAAPSEPNPFDDDGPTRVESLAPPPALPMGAMGPGANQPVVDDEETLPPERGFAALRGPLPSEPAVAPLPPSFPSDRPPGPSAPPTLANGSAGPSIASSPSLPSDPAAAAPRTTSSPPPVLAPPVPAGAVTRAPAAAKPERAESVPEAPRRSVGRIVGMVVAVVLVGLAGAGGVGWYVYTRLQPAGAPVAASTDGAVETPAATGTDAAAIMAGAGASGGGASAAPPDALRFVSAAPDSARLTVNCDGREASGSGEVAVPGPTAARCTVRLMLKDRTRLAAEVSDATSGLYTCFAGPEGACVR